MASGKPDIGVARRQTTSAIINITTPAATSAHIIKAAGMTHQGSPRACAISISQAGRSKSPPSRSGFLSGIRSIILCERLGSPPIGRGRIFSRSLNAVFSASGQPSDA